MFFSDYSENKTLDSGRLLPAGVESHRILETSSFGVVII
jgi:hypothetical protein